MSFPAALRLPQSLDGTPVASALEERVARLVMIVATAWMTLVASWEMLGPVLQGHWAALGSMGIIAENMLRWGIIAPVWDYTETKPGPEMFYCHHPWGIFWVTALGMKILGRHDVVCRLPAIFLSAAAPPLLYAIGRSIWRPASGAAAAVAFVVLPITLAFANFNALEVPVMTWTLLAAWGYVRLTQTNQRKYLFASAFGLFMAVHADWPAYVFSGLFLGFWLFRNYLGGRSVFGRIHERRSAELWITWATLSVLSGLFYVAVFQRAGKLGELLSAYGWRSSGNNIPLAAVLASRRYWIELSFTPIAIALGKVAAVICVLRLFFARFDLEFVPLAFLGMATFQYVVFKQGADIHVFWPQPFGAYFALAMGALVATLASFVEFVWTMVRQKRTGLSTDARWAHAGLVALALVSPPLLGILRDGAPAITYARRTGGRFNEKGNTIASDGDKIAFARDLAAKLPMNAVIETHDSMHPNWSLSWAFGGRVVRHNPRLPTAVATGTDKPYLMNSRFASDEQLSQMAGRFPVVAVAQFWMIDPRKPQAPIEAFSFVERQPTLFEWMFVSATEPVRTIVPDPWLTWELRTHWDQPATAPDALPDTLEHKRIAHNLAVERGDGARAAQLLEDIMKTLRPIGATFDRGPEIVGVQTTQGVHPRIEIFFRVPGPLPQGSTMTVRSKVLERARWSTTMADPTLREVGQPPSIPHSRMRKGFLYSNPVPIVKRPGTEVFHVSWNLKSQGSMRVVGSNATTVEVLRLD